MIAVGVNLNTGPIVTFGMASCFVTVIFLLTKNLKIKWTKNQASFGSDNSNSGNKLSMFKNREIHFIHLNINSLLPEIVEICQMLLVSVK